MPEELTTETVTVEQRFATDGGNVYDGFLNPELARKFLFRTVGGEMGGGGGGAGRPPPRIRLWSGEMGLRCCIRASMWSW
jgi:hypothetical protein